MVWHNKSVYCKGELSGVADSSLKCQFWTGERMLLESKDYYKFCPSFLRVPNVPPPCLL